MVRKTLQECIDDFNKIHNNRYDYSLVDYKNARTKIKIICKKHGIFEQRPNEHISGQGCPECKKITLSKLYKYTNDDFLIMSKKIHGDLYNYSLSEYNGTDIKVKIICTVHGIFEQRPHNHLKGQGCNKCKIEKLANINRSTIYDFIKVSNIKHNNKYDYSLVDYKGDKIKVDIICPVINHGIFKQKPNRHLRGDGCPKCNSSKGELIILNYLINNEIDYITEKSFVGCKYKNLLEFDFYLPKLNIIIEFDGEQHYMVNEFFGGEDGFKSLQLRDNIKNKYCINNDIRLIRIRFDEIEKIEQILNKQLNKQLKTNKI